MAYRFEIRRLAEWLSCNHFTGMLKKNKTDKKLNKKKELPNHEVRTLTVSLINLGRSPSTKLGKS
jgi:hypothetical protein